MESLATATSTADVERRHSSGVQAKREVTLVRGEGARVWGDDGREYLDFGAGHGVASLGHAHPAVAEAIARQARTLLTCPESFYNDRRATLLDRLVRVLPEGLDRVFLCNSGAEAVEAAIKIARLATGRPGVVAARRGFHGRTLGALSATWERRYRVPFVPLVPGFVHVPFDDLDAAAQSVTTDTAAVVVEIVQGEGGVRPGSAAYFHGLRELCDARGALLVVDEVQTGFGRTGRWFACEHHDLTPDLVCLGKAMAGGVPMGATALGPRVPVLPPGSHGSTFGGNPLACAAAVASIEALEREGLVGRSDALGARLRAGLEAIDSPLVREVRGLGLMVGVELRTRVASVLRNLETRGVIALLAGATVLRLLPPLVVTEDEVDRAVASIAEALRDVERAGGRS